ncbi:bifunctional alpha,alpha-trehalose-phosphate synthase (UDP-forming)/trehalose-phosphatase, partial [bacterium]|nr:bifunctional alpha,alpha-trehalose-phosphate synthase (UDP-forming)/trehalose-phosphatase [bacterium]
MSKLIIVSNRLPMSISKQKNTLQVKPSVGGLATGLGAFYKEYESCWVGWPGLTDEQLGPGDREEILEKCRESDCHPVFLTEQDMDGF